MNVAKGTQAKVAIQCTASTGEVGTFLYIGRTELGFMAVTPIMSGCIELFDWLRANQWQEVSRDERGDAPCGAYRKL